MNKQYLTLLLLLLGSVLTLTAQTAGNIYQWPIEGAKAGEGILYRPQDYIGDEYNFDKLIIGALKRFMIATGFPQCDPRQVNIMDVDDL